MESMEAVVTSAVESARDAGTLPPADDAPVTEEQPDAGGSDAGAADSGDGAAAVVDGGAAAAPAAGVAVERTWDEKVFTAEDIAILKEYGYNPPVKDNRMPYSKALKQIAAGLTKAKTKFDESGKQTAAELTAAREKAQQFERINAMANTNPDGLVQWLASQRPDLYAKYLANGGKPAEETKSPAQVARENDPEPQPDVPYEDGSKGYSAAQWSKHGEWVLREAERRAEAKFESRIKPIEQERQQAQYTAGLRKTVDGWETKARNRWGDLYDKNRDKIDAAMKADRAAAPVYGYTKQGAPLKRLKSFDDICYEVLQPIKESSLTADRNKVREEVLAELQQRPAAATPRSTAARTQATDDDATPQSMEDVTRAALRKAGIKFNG